MPIYCGLFNNADSIKGRNAKEGEGGGGISYC
jgi:hypothetical protein